MRPRSTAVDRVVAERHGSSATVPPLFRIRILILMRRSLRVLVLAFSAATLLATAACRKSTSTADDWAAYVAHFVQDDGRVVDATFDSKSTSEGQSYGLFLALVANDRARFARIAEWASNNLAQAQLGDRLMSWPWGRRDDGSWGVKDDNSAADGDLWAAYALIEAGRLWQMPEYDARGRKLLATIAKQDVADVSPIGKMLLPAPTGFALGDGRLRIDPSYLPPFVLRYFGSVVDPAGPWMAILDTYQRLAPKIFRNGVAPDLVVLDASGEVLPDIERTTASYDAIRVYLWAAMSAREGTEQLPLLHGLAALIRARGDVPEKIDTATGAAASGDYSPVGFNAVAVPYLMALGQHDLADKMRRVVATSQLKSKVKQRVNYYDESLRLYALGYADGAYRIGDDGRLIPRWAGATGG